jgi:hypothetical protein
MSDPVQAIAQRSNPSQASSTSSRRAARHGAASCASRSGGPAPVSAFSAQGESLGPKRGPGPPAPRLATASGRKCRAGERYLAPMASALFQLLPRPGYVAGGDVWPGSLPTSWVGSVSRPADDRRRIRWQSRWHFVPAGLGAGSVLRLLWFRHELWWLNVTRGRGESRFSSG